MLSKFDIAEIICQLIIRDLRPFLKEKRSSGPKHHPMVEYLGKNLSPAKYTPPPTNA